MAPKLGLIKPFNLDPAEYAAMFEAELPNHIVMTIDVLKTALKCPDCAREYIDARQEKLMQTMLDCTNHAGDFGIKSMIAPAWISDDAPNWLWSMFAAKQEVWQIEDGLYIQASFLDYDLVGEPAPRREHAYPMTFLDTLVCRTGSIDPGNHKARETFPDAARAYNGIVGNTYRDGVGVWTRSLIEFRNMALVQARAVLTDKDPVAEYGRFVKAGGTYFVEYPTLCP